MKKLVASAGAVGSVFMFYLLCLNHLPPQEIGITYNSLNGDITIQDRPGWHLTSPFVSVSTIETRPFQVCLNAGARVLNCKLIRFNPTGAKEFVRLQGFHYWNTTIGGCNRGGSECSLNDFGRIMLGYAYSDQSYPFLEILEEIKPGK